MRSPALQRLQPILRQAEAPWFVRLSIPTCHTLLRIPPRVKPFVAFCGPPLCRDPIGTRIAELVYVDRGLKPRLSIPLSGTTEVVP
jgi:hypothetical protein